jgi:branched-chain amino acid transport system substrate-binding protein
MKLARYVLVAFFFLCAMPASAQQPPVRIGAFLAVTGDGAFLGAPALATLQLYTELVNAQGGVLGRRLELVHYDVGIDTRSAQMAVQRLIDSDRVDLIIGGSTTGATMAVIPVVEQAKVPLIALAGSAAVTNPVQRWVFKTSQTDRLACAKIFDDMKKRGLQRVALLSGDGGLGASMREHCKELAPVFGLTVVADEVYPSQSRRVVEALQKIAAAGGAEAILNLDFGASPVVLTQAYRKLALKTPLYLSHAQATEDYLEVTGEAANGVRSPVAPIVVMSALRDGDPVKRMLRAYDEAYRKRWDVPPTVYGSHAHDAFLIALSAIARAGSSNKEAVRAALESTRNFVGANGVYRMGPDDHMGLDLGAFRMAEARNGSWDLIE